MFRVGKTRYVFSAMVLSIVLSGFASAQQSVIDLEFKLPVFTGPDDSQTSLSVVKVQEPGGLCQNGLYLITHNGDREQIFEDENRKAIANPMINQSWRYCSIFATDLKDTVTIGRNWDNENVGSIIVNLYRPSRGYASVSFSRAIDLGYPLHLDLEGIASDELGNRLLLAPFYTMDGMNERGLMVGVTGNKPATVQALSGKESIYLPFLIRKILNQCGTVDEAVTLVDEFVPFVLDQNTLAGHLLVADASGRSVILEYDQDQWRKIYKDKSWQVLSTKPVFGLSDSTLREQCWRYRGMSEALEADGGDVDWTAAMKILQDVSQKGTTWSVVYLPTTKELYFSVYQQWETVYHVSIP